MPQSEYPESKSLHSHATGTSTEVHKQVCCGNVVKPGKIGLHELMKVVDSGYKAPGCKHF